MCLSAIANNFIEVVINQTKAAETIDDWLQITGLLQFTKSLLRTSFQALFSLKIDQLIFRLLIIKLKSMLFAFRFDHSSYCELV